LDTKTLAIGFQFSHKDRTCSIKWLFNCIFCGSTIILFSSIGVLNNFRPRIQKAEIQKAECSIGRISKGRNWPPSDILIARACPGSLGASFGHFQDRDLSGRRFVVLVIWNKFYSFGLLHLSTFFLRPFISFGLLNSANFLFGLLSFCLKTPAQFDLKILNQKNF
jgi:hypothetical protein